MLKDHRGFVIYKFKSPLMKFLIWLAEKMPEPTHENCIRPNTHILLDLRDEFFEHEDNPGRRELLWAVWKIGIIIYEHDPYYAWRADWFIEKIVNSDWKPRPIGHPNRWWHEEEPYGGGFLIKDETLKQKIFKRRMKNLE